MKMGIIGSNSPLIPADSKEDAIRLAKNLEPGYEATFVVENEISGFPSLVKRTLNQWLLQEDKHGYFDVSWDSTGYKICLLDRKMTDPEKAELTH